MFFLRDLHDELDISPIEVELIHAKDPRGERPYDPRVMLSILLLATCHNILELYRATMAAQPA